MVLIRKEKICSFHHFCLIVHDIILTVIEGKNSLVAFY